MCCVGRRDGTNLRVVQHRLLHDGADLQLALGEHDCGPSGEEIGRGLNSERGCGCGSGSGFDVM